MQIAFSPIVVGATTDFEHAVAQVPDIFLQDANSIAIRVSVLLWHDLLVWQIETTAAEFLIQARLIEMRAPKVAVLFLPDGHSTAEWRSMGVSKLPDLRPRRLELNSGKVELNPIDDITLDRLRASDLQDVMSSYRGRCVVPASMNHHFELPSGAHSSQFMRLAEAFASLAVVDRLAYWIATELSLAKKDLGALQLVVDHPSMLILAARTREFMSGPLSIHCLPSYPSDVETRTATAKLLEELSGVSAHTALLVGVASTGRLAKFATSWANEAGKAVPSVHVLYALQPLTGGKVFCQLNLPDYQHFATAQECQLCKQQSEPIRINGSTYLVGYQPSEPVPLPLELFNAQRAFIEKFGGEPGVLRVHYNDPNESTPRHHAFYVDVATLLGIHAFREEVLGLVSSLDPQPDLVLVPPHATAERIGAMVASHLGRVWFVLRKPPIANQDPMLLSHLANAKTILFVDDVFITGTRIDGVNRALREEFSSVCPNVTSIHYVTLIATPPSGIKYQRRLNGLTRNHAWQASLRHLYSLPLPDWHQAKRCPWCREQEVLKRLVQSEDGFDGPLVNRLSTLANTGNGIWNQPFFLPVAGSDIAPLGAQSKVLSEGATPLQVMFTCASAVQQLRTQAVRPLAPDRFPMPSFLAQRVLVDNYTERHIWPGLLRSLRSSEMEPSLKEFLREVALESTDTGEADFLIGELSIAWLTGTLEAIPQTEVARRFFGKASVRWSTLKKLGFVTG